MGLFARNRSIGGSADILFSRNIYLREADIPANRILPPDPHAGLADADVRPMSYFVAHEATHIMTSRAFGRLTAVTSPQWLMDGYADLVAKAGEFDVEENRRLLRSGDPQLDHARSGLYRGYHLMVATLMSRKGKSLRNLFEAPPAEEEALAQAWSAD